MSVVRPFNKERIVRYMKENDHRYMTDSDGDICLRFNVDGMIFNCFVMAKGEDSEILAGLAFREKEYPRNEWAACMEACNSWNASRRWPKTYLRILETDEKAKVCCESHVDLEKGVHQELLDHMINSFIVTSHTFFEWMRDERGL